MSFLLDKFKVLIVDDVGSARKTLSIILREMGIKNVTEARSSQEALDRLKGDTFQLIISDWEMPDIDGLELLNKVKNIRNHKDVPFIMITSTSKRERVVEALKAGVTDYAVKPISLEILSDKILRAFSDS